MEIKMTKELVISAVNELSDSFSLDEFLEKLLFLEKIEVGLKQSESGIIISEEELDERVAMW